MFGSRTQIRLAAENAVKILTQLRKRGKDSTTAATAGTSGWPEWTSVNSMNVDFFFYFLEIRKGLLSHAGGGESPHKKLVSDVRLCKIMIITSLK